MNIEIKRRVAPIAVLGLLVIAMPSTVFAYVGPGAGLSIIGSLLAFVSAIVVGILGFLWFPIRRMMRKRKQAAAAEQSSDSAAGDAEVAASDAVVSEERQGDSTT